MSNRTFVIGLIIILSLLGITYYVIVKNAPPKEDDVLLKKIEQLESKIDSLSSKKDSIKTIIITTDKEILKNEKHYEEVVNNIISQSSNLDSIFARDYIKRFIDERVR